MRISPNLKGAIFMLLAMAGFSTNDAVCKLLTEEIGIGQIMFVRGLFLIILASLIAWRGQALTQFKTAVQPRVLIRCICELIAAIAFLQALKEMPLANATAILQCLPLAVTLGAALFMGEPVGLRRWTAIIIGFAGVLIIIQPGPGGFETGAIYGLIAMLAASARDLITKTIKSDVPTIIITLVASMMLTGGGAVLGAVERDWNPMTWSVVLLLILASLFLLVGYQFVVLAVRTADISYIAPFRYFGLLWSICLGMVIFATYPKAHVLLGCGIVVAAGLYTFYRERKKGLEPLSETTQPGAAEGGGLIVKAEDESLHS